MPLQTTSTVGDSPSTDGGSAPHADRRLLIDGQLVTGDRVFASVNPATGDNSRSHLVTRPGTVSSTKNLPSEYENLTLTLWALAR